MTLEINKNDNVPLLKRYHKVHNLCAIIYDQLTEIIFDESYNNLRETEYKFDKKKDKHIRELKRDEIHVLDWLVENNRKTELQDCLTKHILSTMLVDFLNFIYESLSSAKKGKMTVAYALLRKPLTDELLIFEQLLFDSEDFIDRFYYQGNPEKYDPSSYKIDKKEIIKKAVNNITGNLVFDRDLLYQLRYDKSAEGGINGMTNHALHIVTNDPHYRTTDQNLNFIFSIDDDIKNYWEHYYYFVPYLLIYATAVIDTVAFSFLPKKSNQNRFVLKQFRRLIGLMFWTEYHEITRKSYNTKLFREFSKILKLSCPNCGNMIKLIRADYQLFFDSDHFLCDKCFAPLLEYEENINKIQIILNGLESLQLGKKN